MKMLAPGLENLPFEIKRWGFEWSAPANEADRGAWLARAPLIDPLSATTETYGEIYGAWPMRGAVGSDCWRRFRDELFCYEEGQNVWSFLDREGLLHAFTSDEIFTSELSSLFWVIYGLSVLLAGDWLVTNDIPVSLLYTRSELPWPQLYKDLCAGASAAEATAQDRLTNEIADWLGRIEDDKSPPEPVEPRVLVTMEEHPIRDKRARFAPGAGRQLYLDIFLDENPRFWRVRVEAERSSPPTTSYLILPLGKVADARHADIVVNLRYRAKSPSVAWCHLARYTGEGRSDLAGPLLKYEPEWKAVEHIFSNVGRRLDGDGALRLEFLLGLPDGANEAEIGGLEIWLRPRQTQQPLSIFVRQIEQQLIGELRSTIGAIQKRYGLSEVKTEDLMCRAGLNGNRLDPTSEYELWRFENWLRETCPQNLAPNDLRTRLMVGRPHWRLLTLCFGLSQDIRRHLLETASTSAGALQTASMAM